jgi:hypothetical protein
MANTVALDDMGPFAAANPKKKLDCPGHSKVLKPNSMTSPVCTADFTPTLPPPPLRAAGTSRHCGSLAFLIDTMRALKAALPRAICKATS